MASLGLPISLVESCVQSMIRDYKRGGIGQVAESNTTFSKEIFVVHPRDKELLEIIDQVPDSRPFLISIVGIPGTGKTELLQLLCSRQLPALINDLDFKALWVKLHNKMDFLKLGDLVAKQKKRTVWVEPTVDMHFSPGAGLKDLERRVNECATVGDSLIMVGNIGIFTPTAGEKGFLTEVRESVVPKGMLFSRVPQDEGMLWIKEYGRNPDRDDDRQLFNKFSSAFLGFLLARAEACVKTGKDKCKHRLTCEEFIAFLQKLVEAMKDEGFCRRIYDAICAVRLAHRDIYLTPRTLTTYWAYVADNLWYHADSKESSTENGGICSSMYHSRLVSNYLPVSYEISETRIDSCRSTETEGVLLNKYAGLLKERDKRRLARFEIYFEAQVGAPRKMIYDGMYAYFLDDDISANCIKRAFEHFFVYRDPAFQRPLDELKRIVENMD